jgi:glycosyltransferase involved in cell wall biosynthesis
MADAGWHVTFLSAPVADDVLAMDAHPRIKNHSVRLRGSHVMGHVDYALYSAAAARLALQQRPQIVYASDPLGAGPGLLAARLSGARLIYHEHDSPSPGTLHPIVARLRARAARSAGLVVFPNKARADFAQNDLNISDDKLRIVWNVPRLCELAPSTAPPEPPLIVYYHGSISPERVPETVAAAARRMGGRVEFRIAGYEAPGARGYIRRLVGGDGDTAVSAPIRYIGAVPSRLELLAEAANAHVGMALMPLNSSDVNMRNMTGASNKPFDYMAVGLTLLVSDRPDWIKMFVEPGFARAVDPTSVESLTAAFEWILEHPQERRAMAARARRKIETAWNYETTFAPLLASMSNA